MDTKKWVVGAVRAPAGLMKDGMPIRGMSSSTLSLVTGLQAMQNTSMWECQRYCSLKQHSKIFQLNSIGVEAGGAREPRSRLETDVLRKGQLEKHDAVLTGRVVFIP